MKNTIRRALEAAAQHPEVVAEARRLAEVQARRMIGSIRRTLGDSGVPLDVAAAALDDARAGTVHRTLTLLLRNAADKLDGRPVRRRRKRKHG